jgi:DNA-binding GntR family transcriptional regulator
MSLNLGAIQHARTTSDVIADALRSAILQGRLQSGQSLKQDEIANEFHVSKIPVREALVQLQAEGLVNLKPSRGATVSKLTLADVEEIYTIRLALEPIALGRAIPHYTHAHFARFEGVLERIDYEEDMTMWAELNWEFHSAMYEPAKMPRLTQTIQSLHHNVARYLLNNYLDRDYLAESQRQHREIVEYCLRGDVEGAIASLKRHLGDPVSVFKDILSRS